MFNRIAIENVQATGRIGLTPKGDAFVSTNFDLEFTTGAVRIKAQYLGLNGKKITSEVIKDSIGEYNLIFAMQPKTVALKKYLAYLSTAPPVFTTATHQTCSKITFTAT